MSVQWHPQNWCKKQDSSAGGGPGLCIVVSRCGHSHPLNAHCTQPIAVPLTPTLRERHSCLVTMASQVSTHISEAETYCCPI